MKDWSAAPGRPGPGPEPRLRPPRGGEGASTVLSELSQRHKEWDTARQDLKRYEAAEAGAFSAMEHIFPAQPEQLSGKRGCFPMGMAPLEAWGRAKEAALAGSKAGGEAAGTRKRTGKQKPPAAAGATIAPSEG